MIPPDVSTQAEVALRRIAVLSLVHAQRDLEIRHVILGCANAMEAYADEAVSRLIAKVGADSAERVVDSMISELKADFAKNWDRRSFWFKSATDYQMKGDKVGVVAMTLVDLRNAMAHGNGGLSPNQLRESDGGRGLLRAFDKHLAVFYAPGRLVVTPESAIAAVSAARDFVLALDGRFRSRLAAE